MSQSNNPLVSIIIPFFNAEKFIKEAILSVLAQTYQAWELLLVDDGSTDNSTDIARQYSERYPSKVHYLEHDDHQNHGKSVSRNRGILDASGEYVAFLDADDVWLPSALEEQVTILESHPEAAMVYGPVQWWYSWTGEPEDLRRDYVEELGVTPNTVIQPPTILTLFLQNKAAVPSDILVRRETIERFGRFQEDFKILYEDQVFYAKVCVAAPVFASDECWYRYRQHPDSSCARAMVTGEYFTSRPPFLEWLAGYLADQEVRDTMLWRALYKELWRCRHPTAYRLLRRVKAGDQILRPVAALEQMLRGRHPSVPLRPKRNRNSVSRETGGMS
jgi:glycosyltransferase involved in cell wall biosynthesis